MKTRYYVSMTPDFTKDIVYISEIRYALMKIRNDYYICAYRPELKADENGIYFESWNQGHYFSKKEDAILYIKTLLNNRINEYLDEIIDIREIIDNTNIWDLEN